MLDLLNSERKYCDENADLYALNKRLKALQAKPKTTNKKSVGIKDRKREKGGDDEGPGVEFFQKLPATIKIHPCFLFD